MYILQVLTCKGNKNFTRQYFLVVVPLILFWMATERTDIFGEKLFVFNPDLSGSSLWQLPFFDNAHIERLQPAVALRVFVVDQ